MDEPTESVLTKGMIINGEPTQPVIKRGGRGHNFGRFYDRSAPYTLDSFLGDVIGTIIGLGIAVVLIRIFG